MTKVHIIHGIHASEGSISTPSRIIPELKAEGFEVEVHEYGYAIALTSRWKNRGRAEKIALKIDAGDYILAHSNGCDITRIMLEMGILPSGIILLQPALDVDTVFYPGNYWINVFYNELDKKVLWAKYFLWFGHPWGAMGRYGYKGNDQRVKNYDTLGLFGVGTHSKCYEESYELRKKVASSISER